MGWGGADFLKSAELPQVKGDCNWPSDGALLLFTVSLCTDIYLYLYKIYICPDIYIFIYISLTMTRLCIKCLLVEEPLASFLSSPPPAYWLCTVLVTNRFFFNLLCQDGSGLFMVMRAGASSFIVCKQGRDREICLLSEAENRLR